MACGNLSHFAALPILYDLHMMDCTRIDVSVRWPFRRIRTKTYGMTIPGQRSLRKPEFGRVDIFAFKKLITRLFEENKSGSQVEGL